ncbi:MAG: SLC13 family permease [Candidatus Hinthialibacter sp.]
MKKHWKLAVSTAVPLFILLLPASWRPLEMTVIEHRILAIFFFACFSWILEPIPVYATSVMVILLELTMTSDQSFLFFQGAPGDAAFGTILNYKEIMATFAHPIILLFLGGFFLAIASSKYRLDLNLARIILKPFGGDPRSILLGLMLITALFSMFMSNTAATAMMFAILTPVLKSFDPNDSGRIALILGIPFAANIGGIGTPIGTPPNAIALRYLTGGDAIAFGTWMCFAVPYVIVLLLFAWVLLLRFFPMQSREIRLTIESRFLTHSKAVILYITFAVTVLLWLFGEMHGMNSYVVAMIPVAVFSITQVITAEDLKKISWDVLWLVSGGFALGLGLEKSGLSATLIHHIPFAALPPFLLVLLCTLLCYAIANFMSHTAAANLLLPIIAVLGAGMTALDPLGGRTMLILISAMAASLSMVLPISTPPNAIAYASGWIQTRHMSLVGAILGLVGLLGLYLLMWILNTVGFFS